MAGVSECRMVKYKKGRCGVGETNKRFTCFVSAQRKGAMDMLLDVRSTFIFRTVSLKEHGIWEMLEWGGLP